MWFPSLKSNTKKNKNYIVITSKIFIYIFNLYNGGVATTLLKEVVVAAAVVVVVMVLVAGMLP